MLKDCLPYQESLEMKRIGFNEDSIYHYKQTLDGSKHTTHPTFEMNSPFGKNYNAVSHRISAPLIFQAFRWFRELHGLHYQIRRVYDRHGDIEYNDFVYDKGQNDSLDTTLGNEFDIYEEAELNCIRVMIDIVKKNLQVV